MKATLLESMVGVHAFNEETEIIAESLYPRDAKQIALALSQQRNGTVTKQVTGLLKILGEMGFDTIGGTNQPLLDSIAEQGTFETELEPDATAGEYLRENIQVIAVSKGFIDSEAGFGSLSHEVNIEVAKAEVHSALSERESLLFPTVQLLGDMDAVINSLSGRMREWYGVHFPELGRRVREHTDYAKIITRFGDRSNITVKELQEMSFKKRDAERITAAAEESMGASLDDVDVERLRSFTERLQGLYKGRDELSEYISMLAEEVAPNVAHLAGPVLGAKLIDKAGGLRRMGMLPASTIQVLGAEKAMFRALKTKAKPPKHGLIFQHPYVHGAPRDKRGSRARSLAAKIAIAARVDLFSGDFVADELLRQLEEVSSSTAVS
ncbi:C/D box methylation guide ribonucleoprotein complex aNOP56 subunit [Candidatus Bathyarchaeota archaeon]|nr:C/D box methylation guide ribonucleoprotein complex aNOP56 subunit [Candidatus Bathyarchaeota archaeon]